MTRSSAEAFLVTGQADGHLEGPLCLGARFAPDVHAEVELRGAVLLLVGARNYGGVSVKLVEAVAAQNMARIPTTAETSEAPSPAARDRRAVLPSLRSQFTPMYGASERLAS